MSGSGRKSQYRKSVTSTYLLEDERTPQENEYIVSIVGNRGDSTFAIQFPTTTITSSSSSEAYSLNTSELANLPKKFNKLIWIKTGDHVIVEDNAYRSGVVLSASSICNADSLSNNIGINNTVETTTVNHSKVGFTITHILSKNNIKYLKTNNLWPFIKNDQIEDVPSGKGLRKDMHMLVSDDHNSYLRDDDECDEYEDTEPEVYDSMGNTIINNSN